MAITDPQAVKFCNEVVRPICERIRALKADIDAARIAYDAGLADLFKLGETVEDGREAEGVSRLTGDDVQAFADLVLLDLRDDLLSTKEAVIAKPCVRSLITG